MWFIVSLLRTKNISFESEGFVTRREGYVDDEWGSKMNIPDGYTFRFPKQEI